MAKTFEEKHGAHVKVRLVDVFSPEMDDFPEINKLIQNGSVRLPITSINGQPRFQGELSIPLIDKTVGEVLEAES